MPMPMAPALRHRGTLPLCERSLPEFGPDANRPTLDSLAFPIRVPLYDLATSSPSVPEYRLRRKTPNGTIDGAYDSSTGQATRGRESAKQVLSSAPMLPHAAFAFPESSRSHDPAGLDTPTLVTGNHLGFCASLRPAAPGYAKVEASVAPFLIGRSKHLSQGALVGSPDPSSSSVSRAADPKVGPAYDINSQEPRLMPEAHGECHEDQQIGTGPTTQPLAKYHDSPLRVETLLGDAQPQHLEISMMPSGNRSDPTKLGSSDPLRGVLKSNPAAATRFQQKVLEQAHTHYIELVCFMQSLRKQAHDNHTTLVRDVSRVAMYPRSPSPNSTDSPRTQRSLTSISNSIPHLRGLKESVTHSQVRGLHSDRDTHIQHYDYARNPQHSTMSNGPRLPSPSMIYANLRAGGTFTMETAHSLPVRNALYSLQVLSGLCEEGDRSWVQGMLLVGCLHYALEHFDDALSWFHKVIALEASHAESMTNAAAALYCLGRHYEAEQYWLRVLCVQPDHLEAAEHLVGLLYRQRCRDAIEVISFVQRMLKLSKPRAIPDESGPAKSGNSSQGDRLPGGVGFGSSGYAIPDSDNGRMLALIHAKGALLYGLKEVKGAAETFEDAVLISSGRSYESIQDLIWHIRQILKLEKQNVAAGSQHEQFATDSLFLSPEKARKTAQLVFPDTGELPGLNHLAHGAPKRAAVLTASNSLLSLAKIYQDAISNGGTGLDLVQRSLSVDDILALYYLSLSLQESPSTANNVGILLAGMQPGPSDQLGEKSVEVSPGTGLALALAYYQYGLRLDPKHVHLHTNLGSLLKDVGQLDYAIQMYERAVSCDGTFDIALTNLANAVKDRGRIRDAITYYRRAVTSNPNFAEAVCGLFTALNSVCDWRGRGGAWLGEGQYDRWHVDDSGRLVDGNIQRRSSGLAKRVTHIVSAQLSDGSRWGTNTLQPHVLDQLVLELEYLYTGTPTELASDLRRWAGSPWEGSRVTRLIERACKVMVREWYLSRLCDSNPGFPVKATQPVLFRNIVRSRRPRLPSTLAVPPTPTVLPFHTFTCPLSANHIRAIAQCNATRISCSTLRAPWLPEHVYPPPPPPNPQINVGYLSSDFNNHPLAHLMQSVFGFHNPGKVNAYCYATTPGDGSTHRLKIETEAPTFRDVSGWSPDKLANQIVQDRIHILVNLNGYTRGARNEIFAARPAPIQMAFMGFAGSLGAEWCDYLLADSIAVPPSTLRPWRGNNQLRDIFHDDNESASGDWIYSENVIFCRSTFFCCDHAQSAGNDERGLTWEMEQDRRWQMRTELFPSVGKDTIILGNFNQLYKIEPTIFRTWLRILAKVPKAVLWLLRFPESGEQNLRATAVAWAGTEVANRLIFTDVAPKSHHISRARVCDLFLDTPECNAHTTAADILWSSTPLLTLPRYSYKMCSRMAASILRGALPHDLRGGQAAQDLVATSEKHYEELAVTLAGNLSYELNAQGNGRGIGKLNDLRKLLWENKWTCDLFNTRRWVADVESAYQLAWDRWVHGIAGDIYL